MILIDKIRKVIIGCLLKNDFKSTGGISLNDVDKRREAIIILDFGSQYTQLIARRIRESNVFCELLPFNTPLSEIISRQPSGIILSGGPASVYDTHAPNLPDHFIERINCPVLGICYGFQLIALALGGEVQPSINREYGYARLSVSEPDSPIFKDLPIEMDVWLSHGDQVSKVPPGFSVTAQTNGTLNAFENLSKRLFGLQFHPEVAHTLFGKQILQNFLFRVCKVRPEWSTKAIVIEQIKKIQAAVGGGKAVCGLSGGVDSTVAAVLVHQAIGERQTCIFVDTGLLREGEFASTCALFKHNMNLNVVGISAEREFLNALKGVRDPEKKRKIIGNQFIEVFEREAKNLGNVEYLVQGTLYPDVIESVAVHGPSSIIKSHHNVGGLPEHMELKLIEPLRELFKDEVRVIGRELGVPEEILNRHPFPGPGLAVRILGEVKSDGLILLRAADRIVEEELKLANQYHIVWQAFPVLLPVSTVGVMGDFRTYERVLAIRAVTSVDGMTADWARLPHDVLGRISTRLVSEVRGINRVVYDISSKPPSTIEWE
ncbi:MAG: glutamine-hydrolyzing GMP synthase [Acidobacteria bacterium]|nr:glutamine-hydrolyzing GMP synthase [Acidobacteriota bacterium]